MTAIYEMAQRGRPPLAGPVSDLDRERGRRVAKWIRSGMMPPHQIVELNNRDVAKLIEKSPSAVGYYLNDCYDTRTGRMIFPKVETLQVIAEKLKIDINEGLGARYWTSSTSPNKSDFGISHKIPDAQNARLIERLRFIADSYVIHAYNGKVAPRGIEAVIEAMLNSVAVDGTEPPEELADYSLVEKSSIEET